jgi:hypothetical protein
VRALGVRVEECQLGSGGVSSPSQRCDGLPKTGRPRMSARDRTPTTGRITEQTRDSLTAWIRSSGIRSEDYFFPARFHSSPALSTRQYARVVRDWIREIGLDASAYGTQQPADHNEVRRMSRAILERLFHTE